MERVFETPAGKSASRETPQASAEKDPGPPVVSECLEWKSLHIPSFRNPKLDQCYPFLQFRINGVELAPK
ncbi:hypothetical protein PSKAS_39170 [Peribacillus sp. N1]